MKPGPCIAAIALILGFGSNTMVAQAIFRVATRELTYSTSPRGNGMGGAEATIPTSDASGTIANPGQLGLFSLDNLFSASTYAPKTDLLPSLDIPYAMTVSALNAGINLRDLLSLPFNAGIGAGYSRTFVDFGTFVLTRSSGPTPMATLEMNQTYENYSVGAGIEYYVRLGIGMNFKSITSRMPGFGIDVPPTVYTATPSATDFGILMDIPVGPIVSGFSGAPLSIAKGIDPFFDISVCYVKSNVGGEVHYFDVSQGDPLPRTATLGLGLEGGISAMAGETKWRMISFSLSRQAEDILVNAHNDGTFDYKGGVGDISIGENLFAGRATGDLLVRKGWEIGAAELLYIRGGSVKGQRYDYATSGYGVCLGGLVRLLENAVPACADMRWVAFIGDHVDVQYHSATYTTTSSFWDGTTFKGLNVVVRGIPW